MENESTELQKRRDITDTSDIPGRRRIGQRFSISGLFYKASRDRKRSSIIYQDSIEESVPDTKMSIPMNTNNISFDDDFQMGDSSTASSTDGPQKMLTMRDQDQIVQELKKENFDLKLRLYMSQKNSETNDSKVNEYEQQLGAVLSKFEEQQRIFEEQQRQYEQQARELQEAKQRSKALQKKNKNLETQCQIKEEKIQNLSLSLNKISSSMVNISSPRHYTATRGGVRSMYFADSDCEEDIRDECDSEYPLNSTPQQVSRVAPMRRDDVSLNSYNEGVRLVDNERGHPSRNSYESTSSDPTAHITKNIYHTTINNPSQTTDNIGIVKPNNSRTVVDVEIPDNTREEPPTNTKKKKKKGLLNVFKLCSGKSGQAMSREESIYHKKPAQQPARVTMTTYNNNVEP